MKKKKDITDKYIQTTLVAIAFTALLGILCLTSPMNKTNLNEIVIAEESEDEEIERKIEISIYSEGVNNKTANGFSKDELSDVGKPKTKEETKQKEEEKEKTEEKTFEELLRLADQKIEKEFEEEIKRQRQRELELKKEQEALKKEKELGIQNKIDAYIEDTELEGLGESFYENSKRYDINPIFTTAVAVLESGHGTSELAKNKNNLYGYNARDDIEGKSPYDLATTFSSKEASIEAFCKLIRNNYIDEGRESIVDIGEKYSSDKEWASKVAKIMSDIENNR